MVMRFLLRLRRLFFALGLREEDRGFSVGIRCIRSERIRFLPRPCLLRSHRVPPWGPDPDTDRTAIPSRRFWTGPPILAILWNMLLFAGIRRIPAMRWTQLKKARKGKGFLREFLLSEIPTRPPQRFLLRRKEAKKSLLRRRDCRADIGSEFALRFGLCAPTPPNKAAWRPRILPMRPVCRRENTPTAPTAEAPWFPPLPDWTDRCGIRCR